MVRLFVQNSNHPRTDGEQTRGVIVQCLAFRVSAGSGKMSHPRLPKRWVHSLVLSPVKVSNIFIGVLSLRYL